MIFAVFGPKAAVCSVISRRKIAPWRYHCRFGVVSSFLGTLARGIVNFPRSQNMMLNAIGRKREPGKEDDN